MAYYVIVCEGKHPIMPIARGPKVSGEWRLGRMVTERLEQPLVYTLDYEYAGLPKAMYYEKAVPVVRTDVIAALDRAGVDNIQYFDAILRNPSTGEEFIDYKAYNILGLVSAANMGTSELMGTSAEPNDVDFHALVLDQARTRNLLLFRLAEKASAVVVHEKVRTAIDSAGIPGFMFYGPGEWSG